MFSKFFFKKIFLIGLFVLILGYVFGFAGKTFAADTTLYVNTASTAGGDCTTNSTAGATRACATLSAAEAKVPADITTGGSAGIWTIMCEGSSADPSAVTFSGTVTDATHYIKVTTNPVATNGRHAGTWNTSKYRIIPSSNPFTATIEIQDAYTQIDGLQISPFNSASRNGINITADYVRISDSIVKGGGSDNAGIRLDTGVTNAVYVWNTLIYDTGGYGFYEALAAGSLFYLYNLTIHNIPTSITSFGSSLVAKNVLSYASTNGFVGGYNSNSTNNASNLAANAPGSNQHNSVTVTFVNEAGDDFHLAASDVGAMNNGTPLSADSILPFSTDIDGETRSGSWDIGADEFIDSSTPTIPVNLSATAISNSQIDLTWDAATDDVGVTGYRIYRDSVEVDTTADTTYSDTGLTPSTEYSYTVTAYDAANNESDESTPDTATTQADTTPPSRSAGSPSGASDPGTTSTTLSLTTNENATCKYSTSAGVAYGSMTNTFVTTGGTSQSTTISGLSDGNSYNYYVRCQDSYTNPNTDDYQISFSVNTAAAATNDYFSWETRTDRHGKPSGIFTSTPFPIDENTTSYVIRNDENTNGKTYYLGTKYYIDGGYAGGSNDGSWTHPWTSVSTAVSNVSSGNVTIVVRGAHDSFDGTYLESSGFVPKTGTDDTHRWMIVGYNQERPIIDGGNSTTNIVRSTAATNAYVTIQRIKIQNSQGQGVRLGNGVTKLDKYFNLIDVEVYNTANNTMSNGADSNIYYLNVDNGWLFHVTSHHSMGHCVKIGDGADNETVEWSVAYECGYWAGIVAEKGITDWVTSPATHPSGIDLPSDNGQDAQNYIVRYNIVYDTLFYGIQLRNTSNFSAHHNEMYNTPHFDDVPGASTGSTGSPQLLLYEIGGCFLSGSAYSNIIYDSSDAASSGITINGLCDDKTVSIYNNLIYNNPLGEIYLYGFSGTPKITRTINILNNTLWHNSSSTPSINASSNYASGEVHIQNNILGQLGTNATLSLDADITDFDYNLYYFPSGSRGVTAATHDYASGASTDSQFSANPSGAYSWGEGNITTSSGAKNTGKNFATIFTTDFNSVARPQGSAWDIGMFEFTSSDITAPMITAFAIPSTATSLTVSISTFTATDNTAVTGYLVNELAATPAVDDAGWSGTAQTQYVFTTEGDKNLYAWAKDGVGNISTAGAESVTVTLPILTHTITASSGANGSITPSGATTVNNGDSQSFTITADSGYYISDVLVDSSSVGAATSYDFTGVDADHTISAIFEADTNADENTDSNTDTQEKAKLDVWSAKLFTDKSSCPEKLKLTIKGHHLSNNTEVKIGNDQADSTDQQSSAKLTATFCLEKLLNTKTNHKRTVSVQNPGRDNDKADKKIDLDQYLVTPETAKSNNSSDKSASMVTQDEAVPRLYSEGNNNIKPNVCSYTVASGDTLRRIAQQVYGDTTAYPIIIEKNKEKYPDIKIKLLIGQELTFCDNNQTLQSTGNNSNTDSSLPTLPTGRQAGQAGSQQNQTQPQPEPQSSPPAGGFRWWNPFTWF